MTLRRRLLLATSASVLFALLVVDIVTFAVVTGSLIDQVDAALERAHPPTEQLANSGDPDSWRIIPEIAPGLFVAIVDDSGGVLFSVPATEPGQAALTPELGMIDIGVRHQTVLATDGTEMRLQADRARRREGAPRRGVAPRGERNARSSAGGARRSQHRRDSDRARCRLVVDQSGACVRSALSSLRRPRSPTTNSGIGGFPERVT